MNLMTDPLMTLDEAATILKVHRKTVRRAINDGRLRVVRVGRSPRSDRIRRSDLEDYINGSVFGGGVTLCPSISAVTVGTPRSPSAANVLEDLLAPKRRARKPGS